MKNRYWAKPLVALTTCLALLLCAPGFSPLVQPVGGSAAIEEEAEQPDAAPAPTDLEEPEGPVTDDATALATAQPAAAEIDTAQTDEPAGELDVPASEEIREDEAEEAAEAIAGAIAALDISDEELAALYTQFEAALGTTANVTIYSETEIEVSTYDELRIALGNTTAYTDIYFGNSITANSNAAPVGNKANVTVYGRAYQDTNAETIFTFTQRNVSGVENTLYINNSAIQTVTIRDMDVYGQNYYGIAGVREATELTGITVRHINVTYSGPQMAYNRYGTVEIIDCNISIVSGRTNVPEEVVEAHNIVLGGTIAINTTAAGNGNSAFWVTNTVSGTPPTFDVLPNADVTIDSSSYLWYSDQGDNPRATLTFGVNSTFTATPATGVSVQFIDYVFEENATVSFTVAGGAQGLRIRNFFTMNPGSNFTYIRTGGTVGDDYALFSTQATGATITFDNPGRVYLHHFDSRLFGNYGGTRNNISFTVDAMNIWTNGNDANTTPTHIWNRSNENGKLEVTAGFTNATTFTAGSNLDLANDPVDTVINNTTLALRGSRLLVFGQIGLDFDTVTDLDTSITGNADPGAQLTGSYTGADGTGTLAGTADTNGLYDIPVPAGLPVLGTTVYMTTFFNSLRMRQTTVVQNAADYTLAFAQVPAALPFTTIAIPSSPTYVSRQNAGWAIQVQDNRPVSTGFSVQASITGPLSTTYSGQTLAMEDALVYVQGTTRTPLSTAALEVYSNSSGSNGLYSISWPAAEGPLVYVVPGNLRSGVSYTTTIQWDLVDAP